MQVNTEVYGARSTWRRDSDYGFSNSTSVPDDMQFKRGQYNRLVDYVTNGRMSFGQPIDYSICYAAHGENMPLAKQKTWLVKYTNGAWVLHRYERNDDSGVGWFWGHQTGDWNSQAYQIYNPTSILIDKTETTAVHNDCWIPNGTDSNYPNQQSKLVIPIVEFNTKSVYFGIQCRVYNPSTNSQQIKWLSELRSGDWTGWKICSAWGVIYTYGTNDAAYLGVGASYHHCGICANKELIFKNVETNETTLPFLKYCQYIAASNSLPIFGWLYGDTPSYENYSGWQAVQRMDITSKIFIDTVPNAVFNYYNHDGWGKAIEGYCTVTNENLEAIRKAAAAYGLFFTEQNPDNLRTNTNRWTNSAMFCGVLDENGIGHGEYTQGADNRDNPVYNMGSSTNSNYNPTIPPSPVDPNTYSNQTYFNPLINLASATKRYVLTAANVEQLMRDLWTISDSLVHTDPNEPYKDYTSIALDNFLVNSPIQCIVSLDKYPINNIPTGTQSEPIPLGKTTVPNGAIGKPLTKTTMEFNFASVDIFPRFGGCFLDYEPYTHYELYVPFCGTTQINASDILGHNLSVIEIIDFTTGTVTAYIMADNLAINTISGNCAISIPLSGTDTTMINSEINNALITAKSTQMQSKTTGKVAGLIGNLPRTIAKTLSSPLDTFTGAVQDKWNTELADYNLNHIETPMHLIGSASPVGMWSLEMKCRLMCYYPTGDVIDDNKPPSLIADKISEYGTMQGFATVDTGIVSDYHGFTMGALRTEGIACTESERQRLKALFATGVILP